jgi:hypothetical protein
MSDLEKEFKFFLMSYPRSGSNWLRYCVEFLTKYPTVGPLHKSTKLNQPFGTRCNIGVDLKKDYILFRAHLTNPATRKKPVILLIRNYKECIPRHALLPTNPNRKDVIDAFNDDLLKYTSLIKEFDIWGPKKILVYYEDLISNPRVELKRVLDFFEVPDTHINAFIKDFDSHRKASIKQYSSLVQKSQTQGEKKLLDYHSSEYPIELKHELDTIMKNDLHDLYGKYLGRFEEVTE